MARRRGAGAAGPGDRATALGAGEARRLRRRRAVIQSGIIAAILVVVAGVVIAVTSTARDNGTALRPTTAPGGDSGSTSVSVGPDFVRHGAAAAPVTVDLYEDYSCPHCQDYEALVGGTLDDLVARGDVAVRYHPVRIVTAYGNRAGSAAACVAEGDPARWPDVHRSLFAIHDGSTDGWGNDRLREHVVGLGVTDPAVGECISEGRYERWIDDNTATAREAGVTATPTLLIDGVGVEMLDPAGLRAAVERSRATG